MPLPDGGPTMEWPPPHCREPNRLYGLWGAWYSGDPQQLQHVYGNTVGYTDPKYSLRPAQYAGGLLGLAARMFWGTPPPQGGLALARLHVPLAGDIAATSSDLLFGEPPDVLVPGDDTSPDNPTQKRIDYLLDEGGVHAALLEAGEICAAYGGVYLRQGWDTEVADHALLDALPPDAAVPEWRSGRLVAVTFWRRLPDIGDGREWRHLERHEPGRVLHGVYASTTPDRLGTRRNLMEHPETAVFAQLMGTRGYAETGAKGLACQYVPNMRPNRLLRGSPLGRSDFSGIEPTLDALDESWTSWMRDLRLGKARLVVPDAWIQNMGRGKGGVHDPEQEIFTAINALPGGDGAVNQSITQVQFAIRVAEHQATCTDLSALAVRGAGYSVQTFGEAGDVAATATEVRARERRSYTTRARKVEYWRPELMAMWHTLLQIDAAHFKPKGLTPVRPDIEWPDGVAVDPEQQARTIQLLDAAKAISTRTKVMLLHPDWDDTRVREEVKLIEQAGMPVVPPPGAATTGQDLDGKPAPGKQPKEDEVGRRPPPGRQGRQLSAVRR